MSRSGYSEEGSEWELIRWHGAVMSAIKGKRGQAFLREALVVLEAMPDKRLIANDLQDAEGEFCLLGAVGAHRGLDLSEIDPEYPEQVAHRLGIATAMAQEIAFENDYDYNDYTPEQRYEAMKRWVKQHIKETICN